MGHVRLHLAGGLTKRRARAVGRHFFDFANYAEPGALAAHEATARPLFWFVILIFKSLDPQWV
jgi:hypothetical protein